MLKDRIKGIWAVGGGKGGTGKSLVTGNIGICLAKLGKRVVLLDADLGSANLHTCIGIDPPDVTLSDFLKGRVNKIADVIISTGIPNLGLISGARDFLEVANPKHAQKMKLLRHIQALDVDYILLDLGAGTTFNILDFFLASNQGILMVTPEPTSVENVYRFIKSAFYRRFKRVVKKPEIKEIVTMAMDQRNERGIKTPHDLINHVELLDKEVGLKLRQEMMRFRPRLIVNKARTKNDITIGFSMKNSCSKYFGIQIEYIGYISFDDCVWQSIRRRRPLLLEHPESKPSKCIRDIVHNLLVGSQLSFGFGI